MTVKQRDDGTWSNALEDRIVVESYSANWPTAFQQEARAIRDVIAADSDIRLEHFGSTAVPGLAAKPIIDILLIAPDRSQWPLFIDPLASLGYVYWADNPNRNRMFFVKGMPPFGQGRSHHVHVRTPEDAQAALMFCDYLCAHPEMATRYATLKRSLAAAHATDREGYTAAKGEFVQAVLSQIALADCAQGPNS